MTFVNPRFADLLSEAEAGEVVQVDEVHTPDGHFETIVGKKISNTSSISAQPHRPALPDLPKERAQPVHYRRPGTFSANRNRPAFPQ